MLNVDGERLFSDDIWMSVFETAISWLAPPDCLNCGAEGQTLCASCADFGLKPFGQRCWRCNSLSPLSRTCPACRSVGPLAFVWVCTTYDGVAQALVRKYKFGHQRAAGQSLCRLMSQTINDQIGPAGRLGDCLVVPVPTATSRERQRGFGHSELLARLLSRQLGLDYSPSLRRLGQSRQLGAQRQARLTQLAGSFAVKSPARVAGRRILLVDDVLTTGGTLIAAAQTLKAAGAAQVNAAVFAKRL